MTDEVDTKKKGIVVLTLQYQNLETFLPRPNKNYRLTFQERRRWRYGEDQEAIIGMVPGSGVLGVLGVPEGLASIEP